MEIRPEYVKKSTSRRFAAIVVAIANFCLAQSALAIGAGVIEPFTEEAISRGIVYVVQDWPLSFGEFGFGCGFADLDGDGDQDIVLIGEINGLVGIFENDGTGSFIDRSEFSGIPALLQGSGFTAGDYDGDGDQDLYFTQIGLPNILVRNNGNFQFSDVTATVGVGDNGHSFSACFGDYSGDGWLDLYVANHPDNNNDSHNSLYYNLGNGSFENVAPKLGVDDIGLGFQAVWFDYDRDADLDLYISNDKAIGTQLPNQLWRNDSGQFVNVSQSSGANVGLDSMGVACGDFDGNGWPDLYCTNIPGAGGMNNPLLLNQGDGTFTRAEVTWGVDNPFLSWGAIFFDFDNDSHQDLYVNNWTDPNTLYSHAGTPPCAEIGAAAMVTGNSGRSFSSAVADVDGDGDLDLLLNNLGGNAELLINHEGEKRNWLRCRLVGSGNNVFAVGASVRLRIGTTWQFREVLAGGNGYKNQNELTIHFGLNNATMADEIVVYWPNGATTTATNIPANQVLTINQTQVVVPTVSAWGVLVILLSVLTSGTILLMYRKVSLAHSSVTITD